jgi:hypothetical protein
MSYAADFCDGDIEDACTIKVAADVTDDELMSLALFTPLPFKVKFVITPHQIKDAAELMGMQPILFGFGCSGDECDKIEGDDAEYFAEESESDDTLEFDFEFESDSDSDEDESDTESCDTALDEYISRFSIRNDGSL